jgi:hypothetical protein
MYSVLAGVPTSDIPIGSTTTLFESAYINIPCSNFSIFDYYTYTMPVPIDGHGGEFSMASVPEIQMEVTVHGREFRQSET